MAETDPAPTTTDGGLREAVERLADDWNDIPDYTASTYDQGRVDQRHDMTQELLEVLAAHPATPPAAPATEQTAAIRALMRLFHQSFHTAGNREGRNKVIRDWHAVHTAITHTMTTTPTTCCCVTNPKCPEHSTDVTESPVCDCGVSVDEHGGEMDDCPGDLREPGNPGVGTQTGRYED